MRALCLSLLLTASCLDPSGPPMVRALTECADQCEGAPDVLHGSWGCVEQGTPYSTSVGACMACPACVARCATTVTALECEVQ